MPPAQAGSGTFAAMNSSVEPIVAIATPPGRGGIGIVRASGRELQDILDGVLGAATAQRLRPRRALHARFLDGQGQAIDSGLALLFPAPHSYTGETVLELQGHGGPVVLRELLVRCLEAGRRLGARIAEPGEFTRRAYLNDRLDLAQAEAVADLIDAGSAAAARGALRSLEGEFSRAARDLAGELTELRALTEASLDFPEEEIDFLRAADAAARLDRVIAALGAVRLRARQGALLREGVQVVLAGAPNVGKSSLLNALAGSDVAIVTEHPGTTRDRIERRIDIEGIAFNLVDTAGLRETEDPIEGIGIGRTRAALAAADLAIEVLDDRQPDAPHRDPALAQGLAPGAVHIAVHNKIDLTGSAAGVRDGRVFLSATTGAGLPALRDQLLRAAGWTDEVSAETVFVARERHLQALARADQLLAQARGNCAAGAARLELLAEDLRLAAEALGTITGAVSSDDLLGQIFGRICIGK
jgi:tRNA modification GTPase